jgi:hypothetical protein
MGFRLFAESLSLSYALLNYILVSAYGQQNLQKAGDKCLLLDFSLTAAQSPFTIPGMALFRCPGCKRELSIARPGFWHTCQHCGTGFAAVNEEEPETEYQPEEAPFQAKSNRLPRPVFFGAFCVAAVLTFWLVYHFMVSVPQQEWTHAELLQHLKGAGLRLEATPTSYGAAIGPAMFFYRPGKELNAVTLEGGGTHVAAFWDGVVHVQICRDERTAKDRAGTGGKASFSWGRIQFTGDTRLLEEIRARLP